MAYRLIIIYHLKMKCATCILHCETNTKTGYASMASRSRDSSIFWAALAQRRHASSPCGHSRCPSNPSSQGCAEYKVKDVLNTNETPTSSHHAENPCNIFHSMIPQSWQISRFYIFTWLYMVIDGYTWLYIYVVIYGYLRHSTMVQWFYIYGYTMVIYPTRATWL